MHLPGTAVRRLCSSNTAVRRLKGCSQTALLPQSFGSHPTTWQLLCCSQTARILHLQLRPSFRYFCMTRCPSSLLFILYSPAGTHAFSVRWEDSRDINLPFRLFHHFLPLSVLFLVLLPGELSFAYVATVARSMIEGVLCPSENYRIRRSVWTSDNV